MRRQMANTMYNKLWATGGSHNLNLQVAIMHAWHRCSHHSFRLPPRMNGMHRTHVSTLYYSLPDHLCFDRLWSEIYTSILTSNQKPALLNLWILLVIMLICVHVVQRCQPQMCNLRPSSNDSEAVRQQCHHSGTVQSREIQRHYRVIIQPIRSNHYLQHTNQQKETRKQQHSTNQKKRWNSTNHW